MPAVVMMDYTTKTLFAHVEWTARQVVSDIAKMVHTRVVTRSHQEPAITAMVNKIRELRNEETIVEWSPAYDKDANGMTERGVQAAEGLARTLKLELEDKLGHKIPVDHPAVTWLIQHAADMLTELKVKKNGKTAYETIKAGHTAENLWGWSEGVVHATEEATRGRYAGTLEHWYLVGQAVEERRARAYRGRDGNPGSSDSCTTR